MSAVAPDKTEGVCKFCDLRIVLVAAPPIPTYFWDAVERQPGVTLTNECGKRPRGGTRSFDMHVPR